MKKAFLIFAVLSLQLLFSCSEGKISILVDPAVQRAIDIALIEDYLTEKGYNPTMVDTTETGVRYLIIDEGPTGAEFIDESDIVEFDYIGATLYDTIFDTSIKKIADSLKLAYEENPLIRNGEEVEVFTTSRDFEPLAITYSTTGWSIPKGQGGFVPGFADGITAAFDKLKVGGHALIIMPSDQGYGEFSQGANGLVIPSNSPLAFDLFPVEVQKQ